MVLSFFNRACDYCSSKVFQIFFICFIVLSSLRVLSSPVDPSRHDVLNISQQAVIDKLNSHQAVTTNEIYQLAEVNSPVAIQSLLVRLEYEINKGISDGETILSILHLLVHYSEKRITYDNMEFRYYDISYLVQKYNYVQKLVWQMVDHLSVDPLYKDQITVFAKRFLYNTYLAHSEWQSSLLNPKPLPNSEEVKPVVDVDSDEVDLSVPSQWKDMVIEEEKIKIPNLPVGKKELSPQGKLKKIRDYLEENIIGQEEVIEALYNWEFETLIKGIGNTNESRIMYLAGLPGVGKDTSAEAYQIALYLDEIEKSMDGNKNNTIQEDHLFRVETQRSPHDAWNLFGSVTGHVGSSELSPLIRFLVQHSAGKYMIKEGMQDRQKHEYVVLNPDWKPGMVLDYSKEEDSKKRGMKYYAPEKAIIFLNELHHWSQEAKDVVLKQALEKGIFKINNPGKGVSHLQISGLRFIAASNELIGLYTNRDSSGARYGRPLSYEEMMDRYEKVAHNKSLLKEELAKTSSTNAPNTLPDQKVGISEALLSRIPSWAVILMKPLSKLGLQKIVRLKIRSLNKSLENAKAGVYGAFVIEPSDHLVKFIQEYEYVAEDGARSISDKIHSLLEHPLYEALGDGSVDPRAEWGRLYLDVERNADKTYSLVILGKENKRLKSVLIRSTEKERDNQPISDERIQDLVSLEERLNRNVFGAEKASEKIAKAMLISEEGRHLKRTEWKDHERATTFAFLGPSSTGKTEMAKALARELYPDYGEERRVDFDANKIQSEHAMEEFIWGRKVGNEIHKSEFMKKYDQFNGELLLVLEEASNVPKDLLRMLYDLVREPHPKFSDGKDRPMTNVTIIITGNAGIEWYSEVPKDVPISVQIAAWSRIHKESLKDPGFLRSTLEKYFPEPLINRIGETNIIWFAPLSFKAIRELTLLKLADNLEKLSQEGRRGWSVGFRNEKEKNQVVEILERESFVLYEQGASIDRYMSDQIQKGLRYLLLKNQVPSGSRVVIVPREDQTEELIQKNEKIAFDILVENSEKELELTTHVQKRVPEAKRNPNDIISTAAHEAGHEIVGRALLSDKLKSDYITIVPGVVKFGDKWLYYAGIATKEEIEKLNLNYEGGIRMIAQLMAGFEGEKVISIGERHSTGKSNDMERATQIAENMVLKWGLVEEWGTASEDADKLSDGRRLKKEELVNKILEEAHLLSRQVLYANRELHLEMTRRLARKGEIEKDGLEALYKEIPIQDDMGVLKRQQVPASEKMKESHNVEIIPELGLNPKELADISKIAKAKQEIESRGASVVKSLKIFNDFTRELSHKDISLDPTRNMATETQSMCSGLFR